MDFQHDLHVHTALSACASPEATLENCLRKSRELGIHTIGIANHLWDGEVEGASSWYKPQDIAHIMQIKAQIPEDTGGVRILIGCEAEFTGGKTFSVAPRNTALFDYILIPASHFHMENFVRPAEINTVDGIRQLLLERFMEAVSRDVPAGIAHPFNALGFIEFEEEILSGISDAEYEKCFALAAKNNFSIEIHPCVLSQNEYCRMLRIAKRQGCIFHFGSDAHEPEKMNVLAKLAEAAALCGITPQDMMVI